MNLARAFALLLLVTCSSGLILSASSPAAAQAAATPAVGQPVDADLKGAIGCGLLGAELGFFIPALAGMDSAWAYIVFPVIGAAGGALGGYYGLERGNHAELAVASLTLGMALVIPTLLFTLSQTAYDPNEDSATARRQQQVRAARNRDPRYAGTGLVRIAEEGVALSAPGVSVAPSFSRREIGLSDVRVSVLSGRF